MTRVAAASLGVTLTVVITMSATAQVRNPPGGGPPITPPGHLLLPSAATLYSAPLVNTAIVDLGGTVACSVLNAGAGPVTVSTLLCDAGGTCILPPLGCDGVILQPGRVCDFSHVGVAPDQATYCRVEAAGLGPLQLRGTFQLMNGGDVSAATDLQ